MAAPRLRASVTATIGACMLRWFEISSSTPAGSTRRPRSASPRTAALADQEEGDSAGRGPAVARHVVQPP
jgi:hypothetical protein